MVNFNGILIYEDSEKPPVPEGLSSESELKTKFGFIVGKGINGIEWQAATELDFRVSESKRLGIAVSDVEPLGACDQTGPTTCTSQNGYCWASKCTLLYDPDRQHYYCRCV